MLAALLEPRTKRRLVGLQVDEADAAQRAAKQVAIALLQRRAGDDGVLAAIDRGRRDRVEPGSHGERSLSFSGVPSRIFAIDSGEW